MLTSARRRARRLGNRALVAIKPALPVAAYSVLVSVASAAGDGPLLVVPELRRVLVVAPHPDDETIGCGGTLATLAKRGTTIEVVVVTSGSASLGTGLTRGELASQREAEANAACAVLGVNKPRFLRHIDGEVETRISALTDSLQHVIDELEPDAIFAPWAMDAHPDHRAVAAAIAACTIAPATQVWGYEVWAPLPANRLVDITHAWERKTAALELHKSAFFGFDPSAFLSLQRWRSVFLLEGRGYAEAFLVLDAAAFAAFCRTARAAGGAAPTAAELQRLAEVANATV
jgi:LmbE family N-acetylglucosaminyl deacetylase